MISKLFEFQDPFKLDTFFDKINPIWENSING